MSSRRNPRRATSKVANNDGDMASDSPASSSSEEEEDASSTEEEDNAAVVKRTKKTSTRTSSRSTRFQSSMQEPRHSISDLLVSAKSETSSPRKQKSPAKSHLSERRKVRTEVPVDSDDSSEEEEESEDEGDEEQESLKIQRIVASRSEPMKVWKEICQNMHTSEVEYGSRWFQESDEEDEAFEERFLVKWSDLSYMHCSWETHHDLIEQCENGKAYLTTFFRKSENGLLFTADERCDGDYFDPAFVQVDRILEVYFPERMQDSKRRGKCEDPIEAFGIILDRDNPDFDSGTGRQFLVKWKNTPYTDVTYEFERDLILNDIEYLELLKAFEVRRKKPTKSEVKKAMKLGEAEERRLAELFSDEDGEKKQSKVKAYQDELANYVYPNGGQLRDYQAEGVTWLAMNYLFNRSSILCDEMGLGKTLQTAAFIDFVDKKLHRRGPFLIVAPLSTIPHWQREFTNWTDLNTFVYHGSAKDRERIREFEFAFECDRPKSGVAFNQSFLRKCMPKSKTTFERTFMAQVVITTPEMLVTDDFVELTNVDWEVLVVDEAHRLKNHSSRLASNLRDRRFEFGHTLLLTGTPIQNNMTELWTLLNFVDPDEFENMDDFLGQYGEVKSKERVDKLHETIRPYILRRLKEDVEKSVPPKEETLIEVELTVLQKKYYRALYEKNVQFLHKNKAKAIDGPSLNNLAMQLRKCCNHPFLLNGVEEEVRSQDNDKSSEGDFLVKASGKLVLLDKLLPRLRDDGHRVLIFSQFKIMLDVLEDYLVAREMKFERIDGSITGNKRQMAIDRFQSPSVEGKEAPLVMLLSTRAGGVGINLTAADTCIIFDSDWNPQNDLQAQARCHRIGQTKDVKVYRLLSRKTYEMQMFHMSSLKMGLDQAVLQGIEGNGSSGEDAMTKEEVERLLRHGAYDIFNEEKAGSTDAESNDFVQQDLDSILERRSKTVIHDNTGSNSNAAGGTFSKASFRAPKTPASGQSKAQHDDIDIDDPDFWTKIVGEAKVNDNDTIVTGKKRNRTQALYSETAYDKKLNGTLRLSDDSDSSDASDSESDEWSVQGAELESPDSDVEVSEALPAKKPARKKKERAKWGGSRSNQWDKKDVEALLKALQMYGYSNITWDLLAEKASLDTERYDDTEEVKRMCWSILLFIIQDAADDDALQAKRRAERKAEKEREVSNTTAVAAATAKSGGILACSDLEALSSQNDLGDLRIGAFKKLVDSNASWLKKVLKDAAEFARTHVPRSKHAIERALQSHDSPSNPPSHSLEALFAANLWPSLRSRGWTADTVVGGELSGSRRYVHSGAEYHSLHAVLNAIPGIHPELTANVENILSSAGSEPKRQDEPPFLGAASLDLESITPSSVSSFLDMFAPLQLVLDRVKDRNIKWHRKTLNTCSVLSVAHSLVKRASDIAGSASINDKIANLLCLNKRIALPHPSWTSRHDAVLINAIVKHGWIEQDSCCRAITADSSIKWGAPFDDGGANRRTAGDDPKREPDLNLLRETARQAAEFLNTEKDMIEKVKGFNAALIVKSYGLVESTEAVVESTDEADILLDTCSKWKVDDNLLLHTLTAEGAAETSGENDKEVEVELPTKKGLVKRAKAVLARGSTTPEQPSLAVVSVTVNPEPDHEFTALDQTNPCNMFLSEMLRCLLKMAFVKSSQAKKVAKYLCSNAQAEARRLCEGVKNRGGENDSEVRELTKIAEHIRLVGRTMVSSPRPAKNVLRVILGDPPIVPKNSLEPVFPFLGSMQVAALGGGVSARPYGASTEKKKSGASKSGEGAAGDRAISRAIAEGGEKNKEARGKFSYRPDPSVLELTASETLILSILCTMGLPVWSEEHAVELISNYEDTDSDVMHAGIGNVITWRLVADLMLAGAEGWVQQATGRLERARSMTITESNKEKRLADIVDLEREYQAKRRALSVARDDVANPLKFAKKCIMLLEAVRLKMGRVDTNHGSATKQIKSLNKSENCLGPRVLSWMGSEISRWARSLNIVDRAHRPFSNTVSSTILDGEEGVTLFAIMNKKSSRSVFAQIAQLTRSRSIFNANVENEMRELVERAAKQSRFAQDAWEDMPAWWNSSAGHGTSIHDYDLLDGLLFHGYHNYHNIFSNTDSFAHGKENYQQQFGAKDDGEVEVTLSKKAIQLRVNQLTRELHALEESKEALRMLDKRKSRPGDGLDSCPVDLMAQESVSKVAAALPHQAVQPGIQAFFSSSKSASEVLDLCNDSYEEVVAPSNEEPRSQSNSDIEIVEPPQQEVPGSDGSELENVSPPNEESVAKRKECPSGSEFDTGSPEKKAKPHGKEPPKQSDSDIEVVALPEEETESDGSEVEVVSASTVEGAAKRKDCPSDTESEHGSPEKKSKLV